jgi:hypothetical protein
MRQHLTSEDLDAIERGTLPLERVLSISEHLRACAECSVRVERFVSKTRIPALRGEIDSEDSLHVVPEELAAFHGRTLPRDRIAGVESHLAVCELCALDLADLEHLARPEIRQRTYRRFAAMAALVAGALFCVALWREQTAPPAIATPQRTTTPITATAPPPPPDRSSSIPPAAKDYGRQDWTAAVARAMREGRLEVSPVVAALSAAASPLRGGGAEPRAPRVLEPAGEVIEPRRPRFRWEPTAGATYVVSIAKRAREIERSGQLSAASWRPSRPLERGVAYSWQVEVISNGTSIVIPAPPAPPAMFRLLDAEALREITEARRRFSDDHFLLAVLYARRGMVSRAETELRTFIENEQPLNAESLLSSLRAQPH